MRAIILSVFALTLTAACGNNASDGTPFGAVGPEQNSFLVTPSDPLEIPPTLALPVPTPDGENRATQ